MSYAVHLIQCVVDRAVQIATKRAMNGNPVARIVWIPPQSATADPMGNFAVQDCGPMSAGDTPPWEEK